MRIYRTSNKARKMKCFIMSVKCEFDIILILIDAVSRYLYHVDVLFEIDVVSRDTGLTGVATILYLGFWIGNKFL